MIVGKAAPESFQIRPRFALLLSWVAALVYLPGASPLRGWPLREAWMAGERRTVSVCRQEMTALEEPRFLIEVEGKLYLTAAVLEYDPKHPKITKEQAKTIRDLHGHFERGRKAKAAHFPSELMTEEVIGAMMVGPGPAPGRSKR